MSELTETSTGRDSAAPVWRISIAGGLVGILCGVISASTAFAWATDLYDGYAWWFRLAGPATLTMLVWVRLRRRNQCTVGDAGRHPAQARPGR